MNILSEAPTALYSQGASAVSHSASPSREGLALLLLDRLTQAEGGEQAESVRTYTLDLLREILLTIDGKRTPPLVAFSGVDRRTSPLERRPT
jgi:hypothetical protein